MQQTRSLCSACATICQHNEANYIYLLFTERHPPPLLRSVQSKENINTRQKLNRQLFILLYLTAYILYSGIASLHSSLGLALSWNNAITRCQRLV